MTTPIDKTQGLQHAYFANGCFWCSEAVFKRLRGVESVTSGYSGGTREDPSYDQVVTGVSGHAESIDVVYDPDSVSYEKLLAVFFATHDPTSLNKQGYDMGPMYRSAIFYRNEDEKKRSEKFIADLEEEKVYDKPIVTTLEKFSGFYPAESYHQNFYESGMRPDYCEYIINPKLAKLRQSFKDDLKEEYK